MPYCLILKKCSHVLCLWMLLFKFVRELWLDLVPPANLKADIIFQHWMHPNTTTHLLFVFAIHTRQQIAMKWKAIKLVLATYMHKSTSTLAFNGEVCRKHSMENHVGRLTIQVSILFVNWVKSCRNLYWLHVHKKFKLLIFNVLPLLVLRSPSVSVFYHPWLPQW